MKTALITGATSGIGKEFALQLAKRGYRLIITGRRTERLEELKSQLEVPVEIISVDLSKKKECFNLLEQLKDENNLKNTYLKKAAGEKHGKRNSA